MKYNSVKMIIVFFIAFCFWNTNIIAQAADGDYESAMDNGQIKAKQLYKEALVNMDRQNADYDVQVAVNSSMGKLTLTDDIKYQKSPFLMKSTINGEFLSLAKQTIPFLSMTQYMESSGNMMKTYYAVEDKKKSRQEWHVQKMPMSKTLQEQLAMSSTDEKYIQQVQDNLDAIDKIDIESENEDIQQLKIVYDNKKLFNIAKLMQNSSMVSAGMPSEDRQYFMNMLTDIFEDLQNSKNITSTVEIDKATHQIVDIQFDMSDQLRAIIKSIIKTVPAPDAVIPEIKPADKTKALKAASAASDKPSVNSADNAKEPELMMSSIIGKDGAMLKGLIDSLNAQISIKIKPIDDVMQLAIPQEVRDSAKEDKTPGSAAENIQGLYDSQN